jgi:cyclic pyranopterin phosphate synthase
MNKLTHLDSQGNAQMVDVGDKDETERVAVATGRVTMASETLALIETGGHKKGDVLAVARIAGIQGAKRCSELIPLCHPLMITSVKLNFELCQQSSSVLIEATCKVKGRTGIEMEALTAVSVAGLAIYDMCKAVDKGMIIDSVCLQQKSGGRSGDFQRQGDS